jgi:hypothetical protein
MVLMIRNLCPVTIIRCSRSQVQKLRGKIDMTSSLMRNKEASLAEGFDDLSPSYVRELLRQ